MPQCWARALLPRKPSTVQAATAPKRATAARFNVCRRLSCRASPSPTRSTVLMASLSPAASPLVPLDTVPRRHGRGLTPGGRRIAGRNLDRLSGSRHRPGNFAQIGRLEQPTQPDLIAAEPLRKNAAVGADDEPERGDAHLVPGKGAAAVLGQAGKGQAVAIDEAGHLVPRSRHDRGDPEA